MKNSIPKLLNGLRPTLPTIAAWVDVSLGLAQQWQQGTRQPNAADRARLVANVRKHAQTLLALAHTVESEGNEEA